MTSQEHESNWFAVHVRPNQERAASRSLESRGLEVFLPTYRERRAWSDRTKVLEFPLFRGYVFCRTTPKGFFSIVSSPGVLDLVSFGRKPAAIPDEEIQSIQSLVVNHLQVSPYPFLRVGQRVRIERGPLAGVEGVLEQLKNGFRLVVSVSLLQRSVAVELDGGWVNPSN